MSSFGEATKIVVSFVNHYHRISISLNNDIKINNNYIIPNSIIHLCLSYFKWIPNVYDMENKGVNVYWAKKVVQPSHSKINLRSLTYKFDARKIPSEPMLFCLVHVQSFKTYNKDIVDHIAINPISWYHSNKIYKDKRCYTIIINFQLKTFQMSFITYYSANIAKYNSNGTPITNNLQFNKLFDLVLNSNDSEEIHNRWKFLPKIVEGPMLIKKMVQNRPVLLGNKVSTRYYRGSNYYEIDANVDDGFIASSILLLCHRYAKNMVVDMSWTIQGETCDELPEIAICGVRVHNMDFDRLPFM